jgi:hypothetical protein
MATGIQNIVEVLDLIEGLIDALVAAKADGKIDWKDIPKFAALWSKLQKAAADIHLVADEIKDIDGAEAQALIGRIMTMIPKVIGLVGK